MTTPGERHSQAGTGLGWEGAAGGGRWDLAEGGGKEGSEATPSPPSQASRREVTSSAQGLQNMVI